LLNGVSVNRNKRSTPADRGYNARWRRYSTEYRNRNPLCVECMKRGKLTPVIGGMGCVDHIVPVTGPDDPLFWDESNHQSLCHTCHSRKTTTEDGGFGNKGGKMGKACGADGVPTDGRHHWNG
jgi:5-methylcytosine-specific restriction protein A